MSFKKVCNDVLKSNSKIRFAGVLNTKGVLIAQKSRDNSTLLSNDELKMLVYYTSNRRNRLQNLQHKLGKVNESITKYENANTITLFLDHNIFLISTDQNSNNSKIVSELWKIVNKKPTIKKKITGKNTSKKKPKSRLSKKDNTSKLKPRLANIEKQLNVLYEKHKK